MTWILLPLILPSVITGHLFGLACLMFGFAHKPRYEQAVLTLTWRPWFAAKWRYSNGITHCIVMHPRHGTGTLFHELTHVEQFEDLQVVGAIVGGLSCIVSWKLGLIIWAFSGAWWVLPGFIVGWIRYGNPYMGAWHERYAYSITSAETGRPYTPLPRLR
jgi:hypothetical protein